jgi:hypothetical protein
MVVFPLDSGPVKAILSCFCIPQFFSPKIKTIKSVRAYPKNKNTDQFNPCPKINTLKEGSKLSNKSNSLKFLLVPKMSKKWQKLL